MGIIEPVWTAKDIAPHVNDEYPNQTLANHSACACHQSRGYHCKTNTKSHRFVRLGNGQYCLPEESPDVCPIHNAKSMMAANPYIPTIFSKTRISTPRTGPVASGQQQLCSIVSDLRKAIDNETLDVDSVTIFSEALSNIGFPYDMKTYPELREKVFIRPDTKDSPQNLAEALLWKLGKWTSYKNFVRYYEHDNTMPEKTDVIFYAFAMHLKNNNNPIFDQHTLRSMWAVDSTLTNKERELCKTFLMNKKGKWKQNGAGSSGMQCYNLYLRFIRKMQKFNIGLKKLGTLLMPLGQALKRNTENYYKFCDICGWAHKKSLTLLLQPTANRCG